MEEGNHTHSFGLTFIWIQMKHRCAAAALYAGQRQRRDVIWPLKPVVWPHSQHTVSLKRLTCSLVLWTVLLKMLHWTTNSTATSCRQTYFFYEKWMTHCTITNDCAVQWISYLYLVHKVLLDYQGKTETSVLSDHRWSTWHMGNHLRNAEFCGH